MAPAVRQTRQITKTLEGAEWYYAIACEDFYRAVRSNDPHYSVVQDARDIQRWGAELESAQQAFFRNGAHLPDILWIEGGDLWDEQSISEPVSRAADGLRNALFDVALLFPQEDIDVIVTDADNLYSDAYEVAEKKLDKLIVKQIGREFGGGKIRNIRCTGVYPGRDDGTLGQPYVLRLRA